MTGLLVSVTGRDRPGVTSALFELFTSLSAEVVDIEQVVVRDRLFLAIHIGLDGDLTAARTALEKRGAELGVTVDVEPLETASRGRRDDRHIVTVLGSPLTVGALAGLTQAIAVCGANIDRIVRLSRYPVLCFELLVSGGDAATLRSALSREAAVEGIDVAVQPASLYRRATRLVVLDVDSTLIRGEVIEMLAEHAGCGDEVARVTAAAMAGELDFEESLRRRVALLEGLPDTAVAEVRESVQLTPGAQTLVRTLKRLGYTVGIVSGGFTAVTDALAERLGLDFAAANTLEVVDGRLTGRLVGDVVDRAGKADALQRFATAAGIPLSQTVAIGDGANDLDMLARAGLGIAFNAKPVVRDAADAAVSVPYLDAILFLLGISREEIEAADAAATE